MTLEEIEAEAEFVVQVARLIRGLEGVKNWAARSGATGLEQWCAEALSPTGKLDVFPPVAAVEQDPRETIKALADALRRASTSLGRLGVSRGVGGEIRKVALGIKRPIDDALRLAGR